MNIRFVRATYWAGAVIDTLAAIQLLVPRGTTLLGFPGMRESGVTGQTAVTAAALMLGFSAILIWAAAQPVARRGVLAVTLGVIATLAIANVAYGLSGTAEWAELVPPLVIQAVLATMFGVSVRTTHRTASANRAAVAK